MGDFCAVITVINLLIGTTLPLPYGYEYHHKHNKHQDSGHELVYAMPPLQPPQPFVIPYTPWGPYNQRDNTEEHHLLYTNPMFQEQIPKHLKSFSNLKPYGNHQSYVNRRFDGFGEHSEMPNEYFGQTASGFESYDQQYSPNMRGPIRHSNRIVYEEHVNLDGSRMPRGHHHHLNQQEEDIFGKQYVNSQFEKHKPSNYEQLGQHIHTPISQFQEQQQQDDTQEFDQLNSYGQQQFEQFNQQSQDDHQESNLEFEEKSSVSIPESGNLMAQSQQQDENNSGHYQSEDQQETIGFTDGTQEQQTGAYQEHTDLEFGSNTPQISGRLIEPSSQETKTFAEFQTHDEMQDQHQTEDLHQQQKHDFGQQEQSNLDIGSNKPLMSDKLKGQSQQEFEHFGQQYETGSRDERQTGQFTNIQQSGLDTEDFSQPFQSQNEFTSEEQQKTEDLMGQQTDNSGQQSHIYLELNHGQQHSVSEFGSSISSEPVKLLAKTEQQSEDFGKQYQEQDQQSDLEFGSNNPKSGKLVDQTAQQNEDIGQQYQGQNIKEFDQQSQQSDLELVSSKLEKSGKLLDQAEQQSKDFRQKQSDLEFGSSKPNPNKLVRQTEQQNEDAGQQYQQELQSDLELGASILKPGELVDPSKQQSKHYGQQLADLEFDKPQKLRIFSDQSEQQDKDLGQQLSDIEFGFSKPKPSQLVYQSEKQNKDFAHQGQDTEEFGQQYQQTDLELASNQSEKPGIFVDHPEQQSKDFGQQQSDLLFGSSNPQQGKLFHQAEQQNEDFGQQYQGQEHQTDLELDSSKAEKSEKLFDKLRQQGHFGQQESNLQFNTSSPKSGNSQTEQQSENFGQYQGQEQQTDLELDSANLKPGKLVDKSEQQSEDFGHQRQDTEEHGQQYQQSDLELASSEPEKLGRFVDHPELQSEDFGQQQSDLHFGASKPQPGKSVNQAEQQNEDFGQQYQGQEQQTNLDLGSINLKPGKLVHKSEEQSEDFGEQGQDTEELGQQYEQSDLELASSQPENPGRFVDHPEQQSEDFGQQLSDVNFGSSKPQPGKLVNQAEQQNEDFGQQYQGQETEGFGQQQQSNLESGSNKPRPSKLVDQSEQQSEGLQQHNQEKEIDKFNQQVPVKNSDLIQQQSQDMFNEQQHQDEVGQQSQDVFGQQQSQDMFDQEHSQNEFGQQQAGDLFYKQNQDEIPVHQETDTKKNYNKAVDMMHDLETLVTQGIEKEGENQQAETIQEADNNENKPNENEEIVEAVGYVPVENPGQEQTNAEFPHDNESKSIPQEQNPKAEVTEESSFWNKMKSKIQNKVSSAYSTVRDKAKAFANKVKDHINNEEN